MLQVCIHFALYIFSSLRASAAVCTVPAVSGTIPAMRTASTFSAVSPVPDVSPVPAAYTIPAVSPVLAILRPLRGPSLSHPSASLEL